MNNPHIPESAVGGSSAVPAPASALESALIRLWTTVLQVPTIRREDNFFLLGGDPLRGAQLLDHVTLLFRVELSVDALFGDASTIAGMARAIEAARSAAGTQLAGAGAPEASSTRQRLLDLRVQQKQAQNVSLPIARRDEPISRRLGTGPVPLTHTQRRAWFLAQLDPDSTAYHEARAYKLSGPLDVAALREGLRALITRHEILRTTYAPVGDEPQQFVHDEPAVDFEVVDLRSRLALEGTDVLRRSLAETAREPFDLARGPLLRLRAFRLDESEYVLLRVWQHIIADGWSAGVFERELSALYNGQVAGQPVQLPVLPIQYADYAVWQREWLAGAVLEQQLAYWKTQLAELATLALPTDRPRPALRSYRGARLEITLASAVGEGLKALGRQEGATLFMAGLAAFKVLLYRYSGTTDIAVGTPIAGRGRLELEGLIGFFANTLVLRTDLSGAPTFRQLLARVRESALGAYTHQDLPFEKLVEELAPARDLSRNPLFQVCFAVQNLMGRGLALQGLAVGRVELPAEHAKFDLSLDLRERDGTLQASFEYCTDLFERGTIERLAGHFSVLLGSILADPDQCIDTLPLMSDAERHRILVEWNDTAADYPGDRCIHQLFEEQAARTPEAVAVVFEDRPLTYGELNARANRLAHYLIALGVRPDVLVGICLERSLELIVGLLGILKAGGAYVPLDPSYPKERLGFMLKDTQASILLTQEGLLGQLPQFDGRILCLDRDWKIIVAQPDSHPPCHATSGNLAYVIYTSGSTGRPKGVAIGHLALVNHMVWMQVRFPLTASDKVLQKTSISSDASVWELFAPFLGGAQLIMAAPGIQRSPLDLIETVGRQQITVLQVVPSMLAAMLDESGLSRCTTLRHFYCGGEVLLPEVARRFRAQSSVELINLYGPTEATIDATYFIYLTEKSQQTIPIGRPIANVRIYILDRDGEPVPVGVPGELYVGGAGLARGYLNRPEPTAEKFLPDRFSAVSGARMYRTGDLARYLADGNIEYLGRIDDQVKIRGFRIELGEIEAVLAEHTAVRQVVAVAREDQPGSKRLVAYVVGESLNKASLLGHLKQRLPEYMVPTAIVFLEQLPLLPNGKLDRRALPAPEYEQLGALGGYVAPGTAIESLIADVWAELLGLERVGVHDDFFALGGHSLLAGQLAARLVKLCGVALPLRRIFESPTVAGLAREIERLRGAGLTTQAQPIAPVPRTGPLPLSFAQQRLWFIEQLSPDTGAYNLPTVLRLRGVLHQQVLREALDALIARHESLRTHIATIDGEARQSIDAAGPVAMVKHDLQALGERDAEARARELAQEEADRPFALVRGPLLRMLLIRLAEHEHVLVINMHHIISDGWSAGVFERELSALYNGQVAGQPVQLPVLPIQYADYAVWQREWLAGGVLEQQLAYWKTQLAGLATLELPTDRPRPVLQSYRGARLEITLASAVGEGLKALGRQEAATLFMAGLAAFKVLLYRYSGTTDIAIGTPIAGRGRMELEGLIGFFANTLVLRTDLSGAPTFRQLLARVRESALGAYTHQDLPFEKLVEELAPARDLSRNPLFQVCFAVQNMTGRGLTLQGLDVGRVDLPAEHAKFDLSLDLRERDGRLRASFEYCTDLFERGTIERLAGYFSVLLGGLLANPDQSIDTLALMSAAERHRILVEWNDTAAAYPGDQTLATLFEAQVQRTPDAPALSHEDQRLTYAQLNARANQLAHYLHTRGVGPDVPVAICMERSTQCLVGILAVLKAGAAYLPLDPQYPQERLSFMLTDANVAVVLAHAATRQRFSGTDPRVVCVEADQFAISRCPDSNSKVLCKPGNLAYIIYTSGSTGTPKGVEIPHRGICNHLSWISDRLQLSAADRVLHFTSISFDASVWEMLAPLQVGACLYLAQPGGERDMAYLARMIHEQQLTVLQVVPSMLRALLVEAPLERCRSLRYIVCGGEPLDFEVVERLRGQVPWVRLGNFYGPTEVSIDATHFELEAQVHGTGIVPIGRPIANVRCHVLDGRLQPVPIGVIGELYVGGVGLARGYLNRAELTAERFIADPFRPGERLYRTGDLVRYLPDGTIAFAGRNDQQVKVRGYRIELGEIEAALNGCVGVRHSLVMAREDQPGLKRLVAYVVGEALNGDAQNRSSLLEQLKQRLPEYMVPTAIVFLEQLPLLPNGKLDRRALPAPEYEQLGALGGYVAPGTAIESLIADVWAELLGLERVGVHDDFFALGGHSLLAGQLAARLVKLCGVALPLRRIFESPTVAGLARDIERLRDAGQTEQTPPMTAVTHTGPLPLSFAQQRLWFIEELTPDTAAYNLPTVVGLRGHLQREVLRVALDALIVRHESLRTRIATTGGEARQIIDTAGPVILVEHDLRALDESDVAARTHELVHEEANRPFDLARGPLFRVTLLRLAEHVHVLIVNMHHIISDGWSAGVFEHELSALYNGQVAGRPAELAPLPIQYADYALWQRQWLSGAVLEQQLAYWKTQLADLATLELPTDRPRPAVQSYRGARLDVAIASAIGGGLRALGRKEGATLFMAGLAAFKVLLYRYSGTTDIAIGTPIAGRGRMELEGLIGFFANTLVLRTDLSGAPTFRQLLARVRESALGAYTHQDLPFEKLVEELAPARDLSRNPLFQVCFALVPERARALNLSGLELDHVPLRTEQSKFDLTLTIRERQGELEASFEYCTDLFEQGTIERLAEHFGVLLGALLANPDQSIDTLPLMSEAEQRRLLVEWNDTAAEYPKDQTLAGLFEARVRRTPEAPALIQGDQTLSYAQLNARANQLAHYLCERGVGPNVPVALCMERSPALVVGLLGIVKAGGAYVPLDADQPVERLAFLMQDSAAALVLTQASLLERLPTGGCPHLCLDRDGPGIAAHSTDNPPNVSTPQQVVYIIYTSGSTGTPKGVAIRQQGVIRLVCQPNYVDLGPDDTMAQVSNVAFDAATFEIWGALLNGARLAILPRDIILSPPQLVAALQAHHVTCLFLSTALFNRVSSERPDAFRALRHVLFGGEACDPERVRAVMKAGPPSRLVHVYGPTETTTFATFHVVRDNEERATIPIGRPITETQVLLLDPRGELVAPGVVGEIHIGGLGVAAGYVNRPAETRAHFVPHPFDRSGGSVLYRTGDLARWLADGSLEFVGRNDDQVKIRGFRIEPAEIRAVLATHPQVRACHVMARRQPTGDVGLTAYVVVDGSGGEQPSPATLRGFLSARLPAYMLPAAFVPLASLPFTSNGKVDTRALPEPGASNALEPGDYAAPRDALERTMCRVWAEVLGIERVGLDDNFFEIGGHSLLAAKLFARLDQELGRSLTLGILFTAPTVRQLADHYRDSALLVNEPARALVPLRSEGTRPPLYFLPGVFGNVVGYVDFVRELGPDQPIYGLQSIGLDGRTAPFDSIEAMATHYLAEVRAQQPQGPYALIGACFGATVAYEMARQLMAAGEVVAFLGLIAPTARGGDEGGERILRAPRVVKRAAALGNLMRQRLRGYLRDMEGLSLGERLRYAVEKVRSLSISAVKPNALKGAQRELNQLEVYRANVRALDSYLRRPLEGTLRAFEILEPVEGGPLAKKSPIGWETYWQGPLKWHVLPGRDSGDMLAGANAREVASLLTGRLCAAFDQ